MGEHVAEFDDFDQLIAKFPGVTLAPLGVKNTPSYAYALFMILLCFQIWIQRSTLILLILAVTCNAFRFQNDDSTTEEKLTGVSTVEKAAITPIEPEYEDDEPEENNRQDKKIDPLVVDVERKPIDSTDEDPEEPSEDKVEGRFFLKDKLCALGLADVSNLHIEMHFVVIFLKVIF